MITSTNKSLGVIVALAATFLPRLGWAQPVVTQVSGMDSQTSALAQSEAAACVSVFPNSQIEVIAPNDESPLFVYPDAFSRQVFEGATMMGWYYRERTAADPNPVLWNHDRILPGTGAAANVAVLWGDPGVASGPDQPALVLLGSLMVPKTQFPTVAQHACTDPNANVVGCIEGSLVEACSPLGGACVARSIDGGKTFQMVHCISDTSVNACGLPGWAHLYDGLDIAIGRGTHPDGFVAALDADLGREALWRMNDATTDSAFSQVLAGLGPMGSVGSDEGFEEIQSHVRLRVDAQDRLWRMAQFGSAIKANILDRNAGPKHVAENYTNSHAARIAGLATQGANDPTGILEDSIRFGPEFDFDVGKNEAGDDEMRFVYLARDVDSTFVQMGHCSPDLSQCATPSEWRSTIGGPEHRQFHPTIKYGFDSRPGTLTPYHWKVSYYEFDGNGEQVAIFAGDLKRQAMPNGSVVPFTAQAATPFQTPCPDERQDVGADGVPVDQSDYWGDYDDMYFNSARCSFTRPFTDSRQGCVSRSAFSAKHQHVSAVELPCDELDSLRKVTLDYKLFINDDDFGDPDECKTWGFSVPGCALESAAPLHDECLVSPSAPVVEKEIFAFCVDGEVTGHGLLRCELQPDLRTVRVTVTAIVQEGTSCNDDEVARNSGGVEIGPGESLSVRSIMAEAQFDPTNGSPYDRTEINFLPNGVTNARQF